VKNDKSIASDDINIEDRLKTLVENTADDIKTCSNVCDAYTKKRPLAKVVMCSVWDMKLLNFAKLFARRRQEFEFELTVHTSQGVDKANAKLDDISEQLGYLYFCTRRVLTLGHRMNAMKALFQELVSPEQKRLSELVAEKGGLRALRNNDYEALIELEKSVSETSGQPNVERHRTRPSQAKRSDAKLEFDKPRLKNDIFEDPNVAEENNWTVFSRKFEAQKNQVIHELTLVVQRESDRVIRELKGSSHERIRDRVRRCPHPTLPVLES
jgi:hypothetical protein